MINLLLTLIGLFLILNSKEILFFLLGVFLVVMAIRRTIDEFSGDPVSDDRDYVNGLVFRIRTEIRGFAIIEQYAAILVSACIHIAKSDGRISEKEIQVIRLVDVVNLYFQHLDTAGWEARIELTSMLFLMIYEVALADGGVTQAEEELFNRLCFQFSLPGSYIQNIKRTAQYNVNARANRSSNYSGQAYN